MQRNHREEGLCMCPGCQPDRTEARIAGILGFGVILLGIVTGVIHLAC